MPVFKSAMQGLGTFGYAKFIIATMATMVFFKSSFGFGYTFLLLVRLPAKFKFQIDKKSSSSNLIFQIRFFKN